MPTYDYRCEKCNDVFEVEQKMSDPLLKECPKCKGPIKRLISAAGIVFKGSGFHVNDYKAKNPADAAPVSPAVPKAAEKTCANAGSSDKCDSCPAKPKT